MGHFLTRLGVYTASPLAFLARNEITRMDEKEPEEIERRREHMRKDD
jgi:hypothetical protein